MHKHHAFAGLISGLGAAAIWGGMYVVSKVVLEVIPPFSLLSLRLIMGAIALGIVIYFRNKRSGTKLGPLQKNSFGQVFWLALLAMASRLAFNLWARNFQRHPTGHWSHLPRPLSFYCSRRFCLVKNPRRGESLRW